MLNFILRIQSDLLCLENHRRWLSIRRNPADLLDTDIFSYCGYKLQNMRAALAGKIKDNGEPKWNRSLPHFLVWALEENVSGHPVPVQYFPHHLHCYELFVCGRLRRPGMETLARLPGGRVNLSLPHTSACARRRVYVRACAVGNYGRPNLTLWEV